MYLSGRFRVAERLKFRRALSDRSNDVFRGTRAARRIPDGALILELEISTNLYSVDRKSVV